MFQNCSVMIIKADNPLEILKLEIDAETQKAICNSFAVAVTDLVEKKVKVPFNGSYKPHQDEFLAIENFQLADEIKDAIRNPVGVTAYQKDGNDFPEIKAIFVGERTETNNTEKFVVAFQRFRKDQYISTKHFNLFFGGNTFFRQRSFGITVTDSIDCFYTEGELQFCSFYFARQIFDLSEFYRSATDQEVYSFTASEKLKIKDPAEFKKMANTWIRRKIAIINDSGVLTNYSASRIKNLAKSAGIDITVENEKIVIPNDKEKIKVILGFLDEEAYKGPFSQNTYLANSKRQIK